MSLARVVSRAMEKIAPLSLAENSWDNVGLLLEAAVPRRAARDVLLTIDLTPPVLKEALESQSIGMIVAYHPPIFRGLKSITLSNPLQASLLQCAAAGISVFSPHTALDCVKGGINDWLALGVLGYSRPDANLRVKRPDPAISVLGEAKGDGAGLGRIVQLSETPRPSVGLLAARLKGFLGLQYVQVALAHDMNLDSPVSSVAICAGSGGSVLSGVASTVYLTGEMQHHEVLAAVASGHHVILCGHTNTERGYLSVLRDSLRQELEVQSVDEAGVNVLISQADSHPLQIM
ncbi:NGG1p interacting factor 3 [Clavulina sp. PMI_390]|nr:NGG1p interacting factor 3 [Clavulina sp. PMI_390]